MEGDEEQKEQSEPAEQIPAKPDVKAVVRIRIPFKRSEPVVEEGEEG